MYWIITFAILAKLLGSVSIQVKSVDFLIFLRKFIDPYSDVPP